MGAVISYFLIGVAIGTITLVLMATIGRVNKLQKLIDSLSAITEDAINKLEQQDLRIAGLLELIENTAQTLSKVVDKIDMHDQEFIDQQIKIDLHDKVFIDHRKMIDKHDQAFIDQQIIIDKHTQELSTQELMIEVQEQAFNKQLYKIDEINRYVYELKKGN